MKSISALFALAIVPASKIHDPAPAIIIGTAISLALASENFF